MAYASSNTVSGFSFSALVHTAAEAFKTARARRAVYNRTYDELSVLSDRDLNDMIDRLRRYTDARAADLLASGEKMPSMIWTLRRSFGRFVKCYFFRKGYLEGRWGFVIALMAALYPLISHLKVDISRRYGASP